MRLKELCGLPVVDPTAARKIGTVTDYLVDPAAGRLAALEITVKDGHTDRIPAHRVRRVGRHAVVLTGRATTTSSTSLPTDPERFLDASSLVGLEVLGDDGNRIGRLVDARFNQDTLAVEAYLMQASFWQRFTGRRGRIPPAKVHACSRELMIVTTGRLKEQPPVEEAPLSLGVPLKMEDRLREPVASGDGQAVGARSD